jgi:hypothetical protein
MTWVHLPETRSYVDPLDPGIRFERGLILHLYRRLPRVYRPSDLPHSHGVVKEWCIPNTNILIWPPLPDHHRIGQPDPVMSTREERATASLEEERVPLLIDPRKAYPGLKLTGRIINAVFCIPYEVAFRSGSDWVRCRRSFASDSPKD